MKSEIRFDCDNRKTVPRKTQSKSRDFFVIKLEKGKPEKVEFSFLHENLDLGCFPLFPLIGWMNIYLAYPVAIRSVQVPKGNRTTVPCCRSYQILDPVLHV